MSWWILNKIQPVAGQSVRCWWCSRNQAFEWRGCLHSFPLQSRANVAGMTSLLTLMHVPPAADGAAEVVGERRVLVWEADGADERRPLRTAPILSLQFDKNCTKQTWRLRNGSTEEMVDSEIPAETESVCVCSEITNVMSCWIKHRELPGKDVFVHAKGLWVVVRDVKSLLAKHHADLRQQRTGKEKQESISCSFLMDSSDCRFPFVHIKGKPEPPREACLGFPWTGCLVKYSVFIKGGQSHRMRPLLRFDPLIRGPLKAKSQL